MYCCASLCERCVIEMRGEEGRAGTKGSCVRLWRKASKEKREDAVGIKDGLWTTLISFLRFVIYVFRGRHTRKSVYLRSATCFTHFCTCPRNRMSLTKIPVLLALYWK